MFSRRTFVIAGITAVVIATLIFFALTGRQGRYTAGGSALGIFIVAPVHDLVTGSARFARDVWRYYFSLVSVAKENERLKRALSRSAFENNRCRELELANNRLRNLLGFHEASSLRTFAAQVVARDSSGWFKTIIIDKGSADGVKRNMPVAVADGIVGRVIAVSRFYSKVLLIIDLNSSVDGLCQRTRARGLVKGGVSGRCGFLYVLRKDDVRIGDTIITSGLDGVFPKGLRIGRVSAVVKRNAGIFQEVEIEPYVNFEKLEEVLVILTPQRRIPDLGIS